MEKVVRVFASFEEADRADDAYFRGLTSQQRLDILLELVWRGQTYDEAGEGLERVYRIVELPQ